MILYQHGKALVAGMRAVIFGIILVKRHEPLAVIPFIRARGLVLYCFILALCATSLFAQPTEDVIKQHLVQQIQAGFELDSMEYRTFAGSAEGIGRISIEGRLKASENLFVQSDFSGLHNGLRSEGLTQDEIDEYIRHIYPQGSVHLFAWRPLHRSGEHIPFSAELSYTERVSGFVLDGHVTHGSSDARTKGQMQQSRTIFDRRGIHLVYGDESMGEFHRQLLLEADKEKEVYEWARSIFSPLVEGANISFEDDHGAEQVLGEIRIPEEILGTWEIVMANRPFGRGGRARTLQSVGWADVRVLHDFRPGRTLLSAGREYSHEVILRVDLTPDETTACVILGKLEGGRVSNGRWACWNGAKWAWDGGRHTAIWDSEREVMLELTHSRATSRASAARPEDDGLSGALSIIETYFTTLLGVDSEFAQDALVAAGFYEDDYAPYAPGGRHVQWTPKVEQAFRDALEYAGVAGISYDLSSPEAFFEFIRAVRDRRLAPDDASTSAATVESEQSNPSGLQEISRFGPRAMVDDPQKMPSCFPLERDDDWRSCMRDLGARDEAVAFSTALQQVWSEGYLTGYMLRGEVDIGRVYLPNMANTNEQYVLLNGQTEIVMPHTLAPEQRPTDAASRDLQRRYPEAMMSGRYFPIGYRDLANGEQRFVFTDTLTDGCRACNVIGSAILFFDFKDGALSNSEVVGWRPLSRDTSMPSADYALTREVAQRMIDGDVREVQIQLNLKGFRAGGMDGVVGSQTQAAVAEFLAENCQPSMDRLTSEGVNLMSLQLGDLQEVLRPADDPARDTLLAALDAMHETLQLCGPPKATVEQYFPDLAEGVADASSTGGEPPEQETSDARQHAALSGTENPAANVAPIALESLVLDAGFLESGSAENQGKPLLGVTLRGNPGTSLSAPVSGIVSGNRSGADVDADERWLLLREGTTGQEHVFGRIESDLEPGTQVFEGDLLGRISEDPGDGKVHWGINRYGVFQAVDTARDWGWMYGPSNAGADTVQQRGWVAPDVTSSGADERAMSEPPSEALRFAEEHPEAWSHFIDAFAEDVAWEIAYELFDVIEEFGLNDVFRAFVDHKGDAFAGFIAQIDAEEFTSDLFFGMFAKRIARFSVEQYAEHTGTDVDVDLIMDISSPVAQLALVGKAPWAVAPLTFNYSRRLAMRPYEEDEKFEVVSEALLSADRFRVIAEDLLTEGKPGQAAALHSFSDNIVHHAAEEAVKVFQGEDGPVVAELLLGMDNVIQLVRQDRQAQADQLFSELNQLAQESSPGFFSLSTNNWYQRYLMIGPQRQGGTVRAFRQLDNILQRVLGDVADIESVFDREEALKRAIGVLLGDPYGRTPEDVRDHIANVQFGSHDICKGDPAWIFNVHVPDPVSSPGEEIKGYMVLEDATGVLRCAGLPFLH